MQTPVELEPKKQKNHSNVTVTTLTSEPLQLTKMSSKKFIILIHLPKFTKGNYQAKLLKLILHQFECLVHCWLTGERPFYNVSEFKILWKLFDIRFQFFPYKNCLFFTMLTFLIYGEKNLSLRLLTNVSIYSSLAQLKCLVWYCRLITLDPDRLHL